MPGDGVIREYTPEMLEACGELYVHTFNSPPWNDRWTIETAKACLLNLAGHKRFLGFTLWEGDALVGAVFCYIKAHYEGDEIYVEDLFVSPDRQRKGIGTALMEAVETYAREQGLISVTLLTRKETSAFRFYEKHGYRHAKSMVLMIKDISVDRRRI